MHCAFDIVSIGKMEWQMWYKANMVYIKFTFDSILFFYKYLL